MIIYKARDVKKGAQKSEALNAPESSFDPPNTMEKAFSEEKGGNFGYLAL